MAAAAFAAIAADDTEAEVHIEDWDSPATAPCVQNLADMGRDYCPRLATEKPNTADGTDSLWMDGPCCTAPLVACETLCLQP